MVKCRNLFNINYLCGSLIKDRTKNGLWFNVIVQSTTTILFPEKFAPRVSVWRQ